MAERTPRPRQPSPQRQAALARLQAEALAGADTPKGDAPGERRPAQPPAESVELAQLRVRVIALENLVIALLAEGSERQRELAREMAAYISPRPGCTPHPLTVHAASQMVRVVERSDYFRAPDPEA
jgi:hypothetical protein